MLKQLIMMYLLRNYMRLIHRELTFKINSSHVFNLNIMFFPQNCHIPLDQYIFNTSWEGKQRNPNCGNNVNRYVHIYIHTNIKYMYVYMCVYEYIYIYISIQRIASISD